MQKIHDGRPHQRRIFLERRVPITIGEELFDVFDAGGGCLCVQRAQPEFRRYGAEGFAFSGRYSGVFGGGCAFKRVFARVGGDV